MYRVMVMYPNQEGATFDHEYYVQTHMNLVEEHFTPFGLIKIEAQRDIMSCWNGCCSDWARTSASISCRA